MHSTGWQTPDAAHSDEVLALVWRYVSKNRNQHGLFLFLLCYKVELKSDNTKWIVEVVHHPE